ncbi:MAG: anti-sigma factor [Planctomycetes bacterium]|nr:anti-sigma factor [Planctomycetota bacterium]
MKREHFAGWDEPTLDRALEEVTIGLPEAERAEFEASVSADDLEAFELAVAELNLAGLGQLEAPPASLMRRLRSDARAHVGKPHRNWRSASGWLVAASLLVAIALYALSARPADPATRRERLLASATDIVRAAWSPTEDPLAGKLSGDVVWSGARQEGYMRFHALAANDPRHQQYQLWIFDSTRADWQAKPVDGGVFDVAPGEEVVVPIAAKLEVRQPALFAVTLEAPGGVVVSQREHLLAMATP